MSQRGGSRGRGGNRGRGNFNSYSPINHQNISYPHPYSPAQNQPPPPQPYYVPPAQPPPHYPPASAAPYQISVTVHPQAPPIPQPQPPPPSHGFSYPNEPGYNHNPYHQNDQYCPHSPQDPHYSNRYRPPSPNIRSRRGGHISTGQDYNPSNSFSQSHCHPGNRRQAPSTQNSFYNDPPPPYETCVQPRGNNSRNSTGRQEREQQRHQRREGTMGDPENKFQSSRRNSSQSDIRSEVDFNSPRLNPSKDKGGSQERGGKRSGPKHKQGFSDMPDVQRASEELKSNFSKTERFLHSKQNEGDKKPKQSGSARRGKPLKHGFVVDSTLSHETESANLKESFGSEQSRSDEKFRGRGRGRGGRGPLRHGMSVESLDRDTDNYSSFESIKSRDSGTSEFSRGQKRGRGMNRGKSNYSTSQRPAGDSSNERDTGDFSSMDSNQSRDSGRSETYRGQKRGRGGLRGRINYRGGQTFQDFQKMKPENVNNEGKSKESLGSGNRFQGDQASAKNSRNRIRKRHTHKKSKKSENESGIEEEDVVEVEGSEIARTVRCTKAELTIRESFKDVESFKRTIIQHIPKHDNAEYEIEEESIIYSEKGSFCTVIVRTESKQLAKLLIKSLCKNIKKNLKKDVYYMISSLDKENETSPLPVYSQRRKKVQDILTRSRDEHFKQGIFSDSASNASTGDNFRKKVHMGHTEKENSYISGQEPGHIPTKLSLSVNRVFPKKEDVADFLNKAVGDKIAPFEVLSESVAVSTSKTFCELIATSKANAKRISKKLNTSKFEDTSIFCQVISGTVEQDDIFSKENQMKEELQRSVDDIERKTSSTLECHKEMIHRYEEALDVMYQAIQAALEKRDDFDDDQNEALALGDKVVEAIKQENEFESRIDVLKTKIKQMDPLSATAKDLTLVLQDVGVECRRLETALPMYARRKDIVKQVTSNQVSVILGETGSGKSTQMAQYLYEAGLACEGQIACTQPRKVAAITLAERVANEMASKVGGVVGYKTGIKKRFSKETKILFLTDHFLLNECLQDPQLTKYSCIIVDEAHERSIYTDLLLGMIKACLPDRPDLKVIITSATIDPEIFIKYFNSGPELQVSGRAFPVDVFYDNTDGSQDFENFESKAVAKAVEIHKKEDPGDILVFLTSSVEIMRCCEEFEKRVSGQNNFRCFPLHGQLPPDEQKKVFERLPVGTRKIVFATNCAETSITIDGIKYVIDTGVAKEMKYDPKKNIYLLGTHVISKSSAEQRKGRAGRTASGKCYRLFSEDSYDSMDPISKPEILRVHLGQAVLKLAELGVDVKTYDFVQPPSEDAIDSALSTLQQLGALSGSKITDIGRWISKLPFDPRQGFLVFQGNKENLLYDTVVLASLISNGSNLFYRGLNESEEQRSARSKNLFGSPYGDIFTWIEVYKTWCQLPKNKQSKWCRENCINYKVLSFTKQCIDEVATILNKELDTKMEPMFSNDEGALTTMRKMIFDANMSLVCHFLGHSRAGYYAAMVDRQVHFHPSSCLMTQSLQPEWVVYTEFTKTSRDFIRGITVVDEQWVIDASRQGKLPIDLVEVKKKSIELVHREEVGSVLFHKFVGPRYSKVRELEESLAEAGMATVVVEADRELGTIDVFSSSPMNQETVQRLEKIKNEVLETLKSDEDEIAITGTSERDQCGFRVAVGQGGSIKNVFMPGQTNKILIKKSSHETSEEDIRKKFKTYGDIKECVQFHYPGLWGFIRYEFYSQALAAAQATGKDEENAAVLKVDNRRKKEKSKFEARLSWCRRPIKGRGTAFIKVPPIERASLIGKCITLPDNVCEIKVSNKEDNMELVCFNTGKAQEYQIKEKVLNLLGYDESMKENVKVSVLREKAHDMTEEEKNEIKAQLSHYFMTYIEKDTFFITLNSSKASAFSQVAFIRFDNLLSGFHACKMLKGEITIKGETVEISPKLKTNILIPKAIMNVCEDRVKEIISGLKKYRGTEVKVRILSKGDSSIDIQSEEAESIVEARDLFQRELEGDVINCGANHLLKILLKPQSKEFLFKIQKETGVLIIVDQRKEELHVYGSVESVNQANVQINKYLDKISDGEPADFDLKSIPGLMKALIQDLGSLRDGLIQRFALSDVVIDFKKQKLSLLGSKQAVEETCSFLSERQNTLTFQHFQNQEKGIPDCVVCMCPVDIKTELYRLEGCGHSYCLECLKLQVTVSVSDKNFPIVCARHDCNAPLVWKDFRMFLRKKWIVEEKLVQMSVNSFVTTNPQKYKFCKTPNCPVVYEITDDKEGSEFNCPSCYSSICTSCHTAYHAGLTCEMAVKQTECDKLAEEWIKADPRTRKHCPGCHGGVEKTEGCNKMHCTSCGTYFCWVCLEVCEDEQACYKHLQKKHGGYI